MTTIHKTAAALAMPERHIESMTLAAIRMAQEIAAQHLSEGRAFEALIQRVQDTYSLSRIDAERIATRADIAIHTKPSPRYLDLCLSTGANAVIRDAETGAEYYLSAEDIFQALATPKPTRQCFTG